MIRFALKYTKVLGAEMAKSFYNGPTAEDWIGVAIHYNKAHKVPISYNLLASKMAQWVKVI